jgi:hypothetical protein
MLKIRTTPIQPMTVKARPIQRDTTNVADAIPNSPAALRRSPNGGKYDPLQFLRDALLEYPAWSPGETRIFAALVQFKTSAKHQPFPGRGFPHLQEGLASGAQVWSPPAITSAHQGGKLGRGGRHAQRHGRRVRVLHFPIPAVRHEVRACTGPLRAVDLSRNVRGRIALRCFQFPDHR